MIRVRPRIVPCALPGCCSSLSRVWLGPEAGIEALDDAIDDEVEAGGELGGVGDLLAADRVGHVDAGADDGECGVLLLRAGFGAIESFDALHQAGQQGDAAKEQFQEFHVLPPNGCVLLGFCLRYGCKILRFWPSTSLRPE